MFMQIMIARLTYFTLFVCLIIGSYILTLYYVGNLRSATPKNELEQIHHIDVTDNSFQYNYENDFNIGKQILKSSNKSVYKACVTEKLKYQDNNFQWILRPQSCDESVSIILLIKSSIVRNSLRHSIRKTWGQTIKYSKLGS